MKEYIHVRPQGKSRFSFRMRLLERYVDSGESYETEEAAAFAADLAKHYLRESYFLNLDYSLDGEVFSMLSHRAGIDLTNLTEVRPALAPGICEFIAARLADLSAYASAHRPVLRDWERLRSHPDEAVSKWVHECESAEQVAKEYATVNAPSFFLRLGVVEKSLDTALNSLRLALRLHGDNPAPALQNRCRKLRGLVERLVTNHEYIKAVSKELQSEQVQAESALPALEANRPPLT